MRKIIYNIALLGSVLFTSLAQGQVVLEALEGFTPSARCLELVKDKHYGDGLHNFIYCAVQGPNGKKWLNLNLGAEYAKESSSHFNPEAVPENNNDWKASGSLFQYGRKADGHELISAYNFENGAWRVQRKFPTITTPVDAINSSQNYVVNKTMETWSNQSFPQLGVNWETTTNPCPAGYHVMTDTDFRNLFPNLQSVQKHPVVGGFNYLHNNAYPDLIFFAGGMAFDDGVNLKNDHFSLSGGAWMLGSGGYESCCGLINTGWGACTADGNIDPAGVNFWGINTWLDMSYDPNGVHIHGNLYKSLTEQQNLGSLPIRCVEN